jgi:anti-sigma28 factor (negative regulator of flagellin synthesis)
MSIQIYNDGLAGAGASEATRTQDVSRATTGGKPTFGAGSSGEDQVQISSLSSTLSADGTQHAARVQELSAIFQSGRYEVNSMDVSRAIVNRALTSPGMEGE